MNIHQALPTQDRLLAAGCRTSLARLLALSFVSLLALLPGAACSRLRAGARDDEPRAARPDPDPSAPGPFEVTRLEFPELSDAGRERLVPIKVHLPAGEGPFPIVIVSHGAGGTWDANFAQSQHLATHGFAVLALEHVGSNREVFTRTIRLLKNMREMTRDANEVLGRPKDVSFALDQAERWNESHAELRGKLDLERVGMLGHSYGSYTTLAVCGMRPALDWLEPSVAPGKGLGPKLRDARVRCGVALSPQGPGEPFFIEASFADLATPLLAITGTKDKMQKDQPPENRKRAVQLWPAGDRTLIWLHGAEHSAFSDPTGSARRGLPSRSRTDAQPLVRAATLRFFDLQLKGETAAREALTVEALEPYLQGRITAVEVLKRSSSGAKESSEDARQ